MKKINDAFNSMTSVTAISISFDTKMCEGLQKVYDKEFKVQAVKLGREIGYSNADRELGINKDTLYGWSKAAREARLDLGLGTQTPESAMSLTEEIQKLRQENKEQANCHPHVLPPKNVL